MTTSRYSPENMRKAVGSPRPKIRENKDTFCRNITIYGFCRYEDTGCGFNHDPSKTHGAAAHSENTVQKKGLNFDSPTFTPGAAVGVGNTSRSNGPTLLSQAATAAPFTPRAFGSSNEQQQQQQQPQQQHQPHYTDQLATMHVGNIPEFTPNNYEGASTPAGTNGIAEQYSDPFQVHTISNALPTTAFNVNPYNMDESNGLAADQSYPYPPQSNYMQAAPAQPLQYHLYADQGTHRSDLLPYQRQAHDFFIPENLRITLQKRSEATLQVMPNSRLPDLESYHTLVALDKKIPQDSHLFGYKSWIYKALSAKNGHYYALRRLEGFRVGNERAIRCVKDWRSVDGTHVVKIIDAFTTRAFNDFSLFFVTDFHPCSETLSDHHKLHLPRQESSNLEPVLWSYLVQISLALKEIHGKNLAARCIDLSKVILTDKNRVRLNACAVLDVTQFDEARQLVDLQQEDFVQLGMLILSIAIHSRLSVHASLGQGSLDRLKRDYSTDLVAVVLWLIFPLQNHRQASQSDSPPSAASVQLKTIPTLIQLIAPHMADVLTSLYAAQDTYTAEFSKELENSRIARLMIKLSNINERPEYAHNPDWAETGDRYILKLMRDYIFHQVDPDGRPCLDFGFIIGCLNRLDAGSEEKVRMESRDGNSCFIVTWKELKTAVSKSWNELAGGGANGGGSGGSGGRGKR